MNSSLTTLISSLGDSLWPSLALAALFVIAAIKVPGANRGRELARAGNSLAVSIAIGGLNSWLLTLKSDAAVIGFITMIRIGFFALAILFFVHSLARANDVR